MGLNNVVSTDGIMILENREALTLNSAKNVNANDESFALAA